LIGVRSSFDVALDDRFESMGDAGKACPLPLTIAGDPEVEPDEDEEEDEEADEDI
jgi:hypothetical protein